MFENEATQRCPDSDWNKDVHLPDWNDGPYQLWRRSASPRLSHGSARQAGRAACLVADHQGEGF
ncbi:hypothetical protein ACQEVS_26860 [Streptomyces sp. CA-181903]|uniref:hypothetical protein n=1 Tax=Streptomyces sp. CA-181903 TaxID=3240055 RepID=UPI003D91D497